MPTRRISSLPVLAGLLLASTTSAQVQPDSESISASVSALLDSEAVVGVAINIVTREGIWGAYGGDAGHDTRHLGSQSVFEIGALGGLFTGVLLADMIEKGEVSLEDSVLPALLKGPKLATGLDEKTTFMDLAKQPTEHEVSLLGLALAEIAGEPYEALIRKRILKALGMNSTGIVMTEEMQDWLTKGHDQQHKVVQPRKVKPSEAALGMKSTARDLRRFLEANMGAPRNDLQQVMRDCQDMELVWEKHSEDGIQVLYQQGKTKGYWAFLGFIPEKEIGLILLSNTGKELNDFAMKALLGKLPKIESEEVEEPEEIFEEVVLPDLPLMKLFVGRYLFDPSTSLVVSLKGDELFVQVDGKREFLMEAFSVQQFVLENNWILEFPVYEGGRVDRVVVESRGMKRVFLREGK